MRPPDKRSVVVYVVSMSLLHFVYAVICHLAIVVCVVCCLHCYLAFTLLYFVVTAMLPNGSTITRTWLQHGSRLRDLWTYLRCASEQNKRRALQAKEHHYSIVCYTTLQYCHVSTACHYSMITLWYSIVHCSIIQYSITCLIILYKYSIKCVINILLLLILLLLVVVLLVLSLFSLLFLLCIPRGQGTPLHYSML